MTDILIKIAAVVALLAALYFGESYIEQRGYERARAEDAAQLEAQKTEAAQTLAAETEKVRERNQALQGVLANQNIKDANHVQTVTALAGRLNAYIGPGLRLRDPHAAGCGGGGGSAQGAAASGADPGAADRAEAGGLFSAEFSGLLQRLAREADTINAAYTSCRADAAAVRR